MGTDSSHPLKPSKKRYNPKGELMFCTYRCSYGLKQFSSGSENKGWEYYQGAVHNIYHGGNIETDHRVI